MAIGVTGAGSAPVGRAAPAVTRPPHSPVGGALRV